MAAVPTDGDQANSEPLKYKTWVLKVSIHCEGCKRKVKKILHSVEGVYMIDVDTRQHKVVVTGNVDANTLIRKLEKSGKHAELWPDFNHQNSNKNQEQQPSNDQQQQNQNQNQNPNISVEEQQKEQPQKVAENSGQPQQQQQQVKEVRFEGNIPANGESQKPPTNNGGNSGGGGGGGGGGKKKKKKKGHNGNNNNNNNGGNSNPSPQNNNNNNGGNGGVASAEHGANGGQQTTESCPPPHQNPDPSPGPGPQPGPEHMGPPNYPQSHRVYEYSPTYYAPPPVYAVNYNTAYPSSSYTASYYSAPPPYSYAYVHHGGYVEPPAPLDWNPHAVPPSDTFEMFSDENPNACSIM